MSDNALIFSVSDFIAYANQTLEYAYPGLVIEGELANYRVSKNKWVYFDLKDELASVRFFGTVYQISGPLEEGMKLRVRGTPRIHPQYGFSITIQQVELAGEGTIKRAAALLEAKLTAEGLFSVERKRSLPYPPARIGLITSGESAAYADFVKILRSRWSIMEIVHVDVQVQGVDAPVQIVRAISALNQIPDEPEVIVVIRGGGSAEDLQAFNDESVVRAVAGSRVATMVGIGHENDISLAELAADVRASTPSNAAELLTPDKHHMLQVYMRQREMLEKYLKNLVSRQQEYVLAEKRAIADLLNATLVRAEEKLSMQYTLLSAYDPNAALRRGYAIVRSRNNVLQRAQSLRTGDIVTIDMYDASIEAEVLKIKQKKDKA
jgi:exodeoxyribonuclease VII large subunit